MSENYQEGTVEENDSPAEISLEESVSSNATDPNGLYARYAIFGLAILFGLTLLIATLSSPVEDRLSPEQVQTRTQQVAEIKNTSGIILEMVSDDRYPVFSKPDDLTIPDTRPEDLIIDEEEEIVEDMESEPEFFEPSMTFRAMVKVPDMEKMQQIDLSENTRIDIPQTEREIILKLDLYTRVHNGTLDDLTPDTIIQASFAESVLSDMETHYAREITILK